MKKYRVALVLVFLKCICCTYDFRDGVNDLYLLTGFISFLAFGIFALFVTVIFVGSCCDLLPSSMFTLIFRKKSDEKNLLFRRRFLGLVSICGTYKAKLRFLFFWHFSTGLFSALLVAENWLDKDSLKISDGVECTVFGTINEFLIIQLLFPLGYLFFDECFYFPAFFIRTVSSWTSIFSQHERNLNFSAFNEEYDNLYKDDETINTVDEMYEEEPVKFINRIFDCRCCLYRFCEMSCYIVVIAIAVFLSILANVTGVIRPTESKWCWVVGFGYQLLFYYIWMIFVGFLFCFGCSCRLYIGISGEKKIRPSIVYPAIYCLLYWFFWSVPLFARFIEWVVPRNHHEILAVSQYFCMGLYSGANVLTTIVLILVEGYFMFVTNDPANIEVEKEKEGETSEMENEGEVENDEGGNNSVRKRNNIDEKYPTIQYQKEYQGKTQVDTDDFDEAAKLLDLFD